MELTLVFPDKKRRTFRFGERQMVTSLLKKLPTGTFVKHPIRRTVIYANRRRLLSKTFKDGDVLQVENKIKGSRGRRMRSGVPTSTDECMITLDRKSQRAKMPCGHAITPQALYDYCWSELDKRKTEITCPFVYNSKGRSCGTIWSMTDIFNYANITKKENKLIERKLFSNTMLNSCQEIPVINEAIVSLLHNSPKKAFNVGICPLRRACPRCYSVIEHAGGCKMMACKYQACNFVFCFRCLQESTRCKFDCELAPTQFALL